MIAAMRSEPTRTRRLRVLAGWFGLTALVSGMIYLVVFQFAGAGALPLRPDPRVAFPTVEQLESPEGIMAGLASASSDPGRRDLVVLGRPHRHRPQHRTDPAVVRCTTTHRKLVAGMLDCATTPRQPELRVQAVAWSRATPTGGSR